MKKPLLIFIILALLVVIVSFAYKKYCASTPNGCKQYKHEEKDFGPQEGIDY